VVQVQVSHSEEKGFTGMKITGHAGYKKKNDPVCAGVSALGYALVGTLRSIKGLTFTKYNIAKGEIDVQIEPIEDENIKHGVNISFGTILIGLEMIQKGYPGNVKVIKLS
jgi:uncharacterized protein YsxB (DUF464 family)